MSNNNNCLLCKKACKQSCTISQLKWESLKTKSEKWIGLDRFGDIFETTDWTDDPKNYFMHNSCYMSLSSGRLIEQALNRKKMRKS